MAGLEVLLTGFIAIGGFIAWLLHQLGMSRDEATFIKVEVGMQWQQVPAQMKAVSLMAISVNNGTRREIRNVEVWATFQGRNLADFTTSTLSALQKCIWTRVPEDEERLPFPNSLNFHTSATAEWTDHFRRRWRTTSEGSLQLLGWRTYRVKFDSGLNEPDVELA
jgi:hypothetical protein